MTSSKAKQIKDRILEFSGLLAFTYHGLDCDIDPFNPNHFHVTCNRIEQDVDCIEKLMTGPFFDGDCLNSIADQIEITEW